jgi:alpha-tubulin suppressor-like RCC1 family protein
MRLTTIIVGVGALLAAGLTAPPAGASPAPTSVDHWGAYTLGVDVVATPTAVSISHGSAIVSEVGSSNSTNYVLMSDGTLWAYGLGGDGELGDGGTADSLTTAVQVGFPSGTDIRYIDADAMPYDSGLALDAQGNLWGWGENVGGALCLGNAAEQLAPVELPFTNVRLMAGADAHTIVVGDYHGTAGVWACGSNSNGELGDGGTTSSTTPVAVSTPSPNPVQVYASELDSGMLTSDGAGYYNYYDWGYNARGQVGNGTETNALSPYEVLTHRPITSIAQGGNVARDGQTIALLSDNTMLAWGADGRGQLGDGVMKRRVTSPEVVHPPAGVTYKTVDSGGYTSYAIDTSGKVYAWGGNPYGEIPGRTASTVLKPTVVDKGASQISATAYNVEVGP